MMEKGKQIKTIAEFEQCSKEFLVIDYGYGDPHLTCRWWVEGLEYNRLKNMISKGQLFEAEGV